MRRYIVREDSGEWSLQLYMILRTIITTYNHELTSDIGEATVEPDSKTSGILSTSVMLIFC